MDKYEFNIKVEQIKKLAAKKSYQEAAEIAKSMNWQKVKDWSTLATVINIHEAVGDYLEARDMAILAYNRNLGGRKLVYKLVELLIELQDFENAEELYEEYEKMAQHDVNRYILYYDLRRAQMASDNELVEILEDYKENEIDEKYMYELASLYAKTGRLDECIKTCDDIALWFQDGSYVEQALNLKKDLGVALTGSQKNILAEASRKKDSIEVKKEILFEKQQEIARNRQDDVEEALLEDELRNQNADKNEEAGDTSILNEDLGEDIQMEDPSIESSMGYPSMQNTQPINAQEEIEKASTSLKALIANAKKKLEQSYQEMSVEAEEPDRTDFNQDNQIPALDAVIEESEDESSYDDLYSDDQSMKQDDDQTGEDYQDDRIRKVAEKLSGIESQPVVNPYDDLVMQDIDSEFQFPEFNVYDTQNVQAAIAQNLSQMLLEDEEEVEALRPSTNPASTQEDEELLEDEQIEGQLSLADWIETVREQKYGNQDTREFSKAELDRLLDEKDEKSAAYEKLMEEQKALAKAQGAEFNEVEAGRKAREQMMLHAAKTDLAIRTGKATAKLETALERWKEQIRNQKIIEQAAREQEQRELEEQALQAQQERWQQIENDLSKETLKENLEEKMEENSVSETIDLLASDMEDEDQVQSEKEQDTSLTQDTSPANETDEDLSDNQGEEKQLTGDLAKLFKKYREMPGLESQLATFFETIEEEMNMTTSRVGNVIISGNSSSDKTDLARSLVRAINYLYPDRSKKIAKTTGESINHRGISKAMSKLRGTALIVEGAGSIQPKRIQELLSCLSQNTDRMIVIFEDSDTEMNVLLKFNPELKNTFNHRIILKQYTVNELVEMARKFARKRQYEVHDDALLELYLKIDKLHNEQDNIKMDDIKEIINRAIQKSEKRASRKFFGGLKKKRNDKGSVIFLSEVDFKD